MSNHLNAVVPSNFEESTLTDEIRKIDPQFDEKVEFNKTKCYFGSNNIVWEKTPNPPVV